MVYEYIIENKFSKKQDYSFSEFRGFDFLNDYQSSRSNYLDSLLLDISNNKFLLNLNNNLNVKTDYIFASVGEGIKNFFLHYSLKDLESNVIEKNVSSISILRDILLDLPNHSFWEDHSKIIETFVKKYEIFGKLYSHYRDLDPRDKDKRLGDVDNPSVYSLLSICCIISYICTSNLKYINTSLKINDQLSGFPKSFFKDSDFFLFLVSLKMEFVMINKIISTKLL